MIKNHLYQALRTAIVFFFGALVVACGEDNPVEPDPVKPDITVDASSLDVFSSGIRVEAEPPGGTFTKDVVFTTTDKWTATVSGDGSISWVSIRPTSGAAGKTTMTVSVSTNDAESERRAEVKIACGTVNKAFTVIQEGQTPKPPSLINVTNPEESGITVVSYDQSKRELLMEVPEDKIPKVGDIICSGRTAEAPFGFLGEVESVSVSNTRAGEDIGKKWVRTGFAVCSLYTLFQKLGVEEKRWIALGEGDASFTDDAGHSIEPVKDKEGIDVVSIHLPIKFDDVKIDYTYEVSIPRCSLYVDTKTINLVFGYDVLIKQSELVHLKAAVKFPFSKKGELIKDLNWDRPSFVHVRDIQLGPIPVVVTTQYMMTVPYEYSISANMDMDIYKRVTYHHMGGYYHCATNTLTPLDGSTTFFEVIEGDDEGEYQPEYSEREFSATIDGKLSIGVDFGWSIGLYGGNIDDDGDISTGLNYLAAGANGGIKVSDKISLGAMTNMDEVSHNALRIIDDQTIKSSVYGKIWGTFLSTDVLGAEIQFLTAEKEWDFYKTELYSSFFFPYYSKLKVKSINHQGFINVTGKKHKPIFKGWASVFNENDFGLCLESADGKDYYVFSMKGHPINKDNEFSFDLPVNISNLRRGVKYSVYPYSRVTNFLGLGGEKMVCRKGVGFLISEDGQLSTGVIDDVPGEVL
jgi:hypothetical protein